MKHEKKNIDQLFKDAFEDFKPEPPEGAWGEILKRLDQQPKRQAIFPLWLKLSGVAAGLILLFGLYHAFSDQPTAPTVVHQEVQEEPKNNDIGFPVWKEIPSDFSNNKNIQNNSAQKQLETGLAEQKSTKSESSSPIPTEQAQIASLAKDSNELPVENDSDLSPQTSQNEAIHSSDSPKNNLVDLSEQTTTEDQNQGISIFEDIAKNEYPNEDQEIALSDQDKNRFSIRPNIAPVLYGSLSGGSALDANLADNSAQSEWSVSYGINVAYGLNKKVEIRTGINKLNLGYNTTDVAFVPTSIGERLNALTGTHVEEIAVLSKEMQSALKTGEITKNMINSLETGEISQSLEYIEIPIEVAVKVIDEQFELNLIGGASTLWLTNNQVHIQSDMMNGNAGRANNIKSTSFTANMGVGANYNFNKNWGVSIEPTFKYQIEGFKGKDIQFKPYYFGIYSGIKYSF